MAQTVLALCVRVLNTLHLTDKLWWLSQWWNLSVFVGFLQNEVSKVLFGPGQTKVSGNEMDPSVFGISWVT